MNSNIDSWRRRRWREAPADDGASQAVPQAPDLTAQVGDRQLLVAALRTLTPRERAVLVLRFFEDVSERDTAHALGVGVGTVKSTSSRALAKLRSHPSLRHDDQEINRAHH